MAVATEDQKVEGRKRWDELWAEKEYAERVIKLRELFQIDNGEFRQRVCDSVPPQYDKAIDIDVPKDLDWSDGWSLTIQGANGRGKTWLAFRLMAQYMLDEFTFAVDWVNCAVVATDLRNEVASHDEQPRLVNDMRETELLILDDFGAIRDTPFLSEAMRTVICDRYDFMKKTIVTCDVPLSQFEDRIESRLRQGTLYSLSGPDRRALSG